MTINFSKRSDASEVMDDLACHGDVVNQTLKELDFINHWLGGNLVTIQALQQGWQGIDNETVITIADLGCGSGEMLRHISSLAEKENKKVRLVGFDANPHIIEYARNHTHDFANVSFETSNVFSGEFQDRKFDIVLATLFMHHFRESELVTLFKSLKKQTRSVIIINDLHRHPIAYFSIKWLTLLFSKSSMVKFDAPLSVLRAFSKEELKSVMKKAGINDYQIKWKWAFRWQLVIKHQDN